MLGRLQKLGSAGERRMESKVLVGVIGPAPGTRGGIGVMMEYLREGVPKDVELVFIESGTEDRRLRRFLKTLSIALFTSRQFSLFHVNLSARGSTYRKILICLALQIRRKKYLLHLHSGRYESFFDSSPTFAKYLIRRMFRKAARVVVLGPTWANFVRERLDVQSTRIAIVPNAVPGPMVLPTRATATPTVLFVGRLTPQKGVLDLLEASKIVSTSAPFNLVLAGDGADKAVSQKLALSPLATRTGWLNRADLQSQYQAANIFVLPSYSEGLPLSLLEAMAWGLVPITTAVGSIPEVIENGVNGILVTPGDVSALKLHLEQLLANPSEMKRIGDRARADWEKSHNSKAYGNRMNKEYGRISKLEGLLT